MTHLTYRSIPGAGKFNRRGNTSQSGPFEGFDTSVHAVSRDRLRRTFLAALAAGALALGGGPAARAACDVFRLDIPDFDQRRLGLEPNNGASCCIPACGANWLAYITNHGFPSVLGGARDWQSQSNYSYVTNIIQLLAYMMDVNGKGTSFSKYRATMQDWLDLFEPGKFTVQTIGCNGTYAPSPAEMFLLESFGALVALAYGGYDYYPPNPRVPVGQYVRGGGHVVTLARVYDACEPIPQIWLRNPNGCCGGDNTTQSHFISESHLCPPLTAWFATDPNRVGTLRTMWRRVVDGGNISILDGVAFIIPTFGLSADPQFGRVALLPSYDFDLMGAPPAVDYELPGGGAVLGMAQEPGKPYAIVLGRGRARTATLWRLNLVDRSFRELGRFAQAGPMVFGREGELYLHAGTALLRLDVNTSPATVQDSYTGIDRPAAMTYDYATNRVHFVAGNRSVLGAARSEKGGRFALTESPLPPGIDLGAGEVCLAVSPVDSSLWVATDGANTVHQLVAGPRGDWVIGERIEHPSLVAPRNLQVTSRGTLLFTSMGFLRELKKDPKTGEWNPVRDVPFVGQHVGDHFVVSQSVEVRAEYTGLPSDVNLVPPPRDGGASVSDW